MVDGCMKTYLQDKLGLSAYYDKLRVLTDGNPTEPILTNIKRKMCDIPDEPSSTPPFQKMVLELRESSMKYLLDIENVHDNHPSVR